MLNPYYAQLCCVIAADPGAGKTIMAELLIKELLVLVTCSDASSSHRECRTLHVDSQGSERE